MEHSKEFETLVESIKTGVREVSVEETQKRTEKGAILVDVCENNVKCLKTQARSYFSLFTKLYFVFFVLFCG